MNRLSFTFLVLLPPALACRVWLLLDQVQAIGLADLHGFLLDIVLIGTVSFALTFVSEHLYRLALIPICLANIVILRISFEYARVFKSFPDARRANYLGDTDFVLSSFSSLFETHWLTFFLVLPLAIIFSPWIHGIWQRKRLLNMCLVATCLALFFLTPKTSGTAPWRASNPIFKNLNFLLVHNSEQLKPTRADLAHTITSNILSRDLDGQTRLQSTKRAKNVLLIMLEGFTGYSIQRAYDDFDKHLYLERLANSTSNAFRYTHFLSQQRQTHRGMYSVLCGDLPNLEGGSPKAHSIQRYKKEIGDYCLPALLKKAGFRTSYLQAASLSFMGKDRFLPEMGFDEAYGREWFKQSTLPKAFWGVDDRNFFKGALDKIETLNKEASPWFLTLLTVGTHHPYTLPKGWVGRSPGGKLADAFLYLDHALEEFFTELRKTTVLHDTLVIITGDESIGSLTGSKSLDQQWGALLVLDPHSKGQEVSESFSQSDISLSVLDYLNIPPATPLPVGRSMFRRYDTRRPLIFANESHQIIGLFDQTNRLTLCNEQLQNCRVHVYDSPNFLTKEAYEHEEPSLEHIGAMRALVKFQPSSLAIDISRAETLKEQR